jgi:disulfide bond formation protein DsbB
MGIGAAFPDEPARQLLFLGQIISPLALLSVGVLAWSSISAARAGEQPRRFWIALAAGSISLLATHVYEHLVLWVVPTIGFSQTVMDWYLISTHIEDLVAVAAIALLLLAFGFGLPKIVEPDQGDIAPEWNIPGPNAEAFTEPGAPGDLPA